MPTATVVHQADGIALPPTHIRDERIFFSWILGTMVWFGQRIWMHE